MVTVGGIINELMILNVMQAADPQKHAMNIDGSVVRLLYVASIAGSFFL